MVGCDSIMIELQLLAILVGPQKCVAFFFFGGVSADGFENDKNFYFLEPTSCLAAVKFYHQPETFDFIIDGGKLASCTWV